MAGYEVSVGKELLPGLLSGQDGLARLVEAVLNQILEAQVEEALGAERYERTEERVGYRNGTRARTLYTRVGPVTLRVPQTRDGSFSTELFKRYQRSEQAFVLALTQSLQHELGDKGIRIQAVLPGATATEFWDIAGLAHSNLREGSVMSAEDMVDAALIGFDQGEVITIPPLQDGDEWSRHEATRRVLAQRLSHARPGARYLA